MHRVKIKKGKSIGKTFKPHTLIASRQEEEQTLGLIIKKTQIITSKNVINLFDFKNLIIYNNINKKRLIWKN